MTPFPPIPDTPFQSTLPRRERHVCSCNGYYVEDVSIHAPAKGATVNSWIICNVGCHVSIHAPAKGATIMRGKHRFIDLFQSTLPRRERPNIMSALDISSARFNPRSREGSDETSRSRLLHTCCFNPRSREGSDR